MADPKLKFKVPENLFPFQHRFITLENGARIHYVDEGTGPILLLLHGNPTWSFLYRKIIGCLKNRFRCVAPDYPGFGLSVAPDWYTFTPYEHSLVVEEFVKRLGLNNLTIMVQDWGGPIGFGLAIRRPELVDRFIIGNTWAWPLSAYPRFIRFSRIMGGPLGRVAAYWFNGVVRFFMCKGIKTVLGRAEYDMYMAPFRKRSERAPTHIFPYQIEHAEEYVAEIERNFETIGDRPALIIWGLKDFAFQQPERERFQTLFRKHEVVLLEGAGHFIQEDAAEEICNAVHEWFPQDKETG